MVAAADLLLLTIYVEDFSDEVVLARRKYDRKEKRNNFPLFYSFFSLKDLLLGGLQIRIFNKIHSTVFFIKFFRVAFIQKGSRRQCFR